MRLDPDRLGQHHGLPRHVVGTAIFSESMEGGSVNISVEITGLMVMTSGEHGIHVHMIGGCE